MIPGYTPLHPESCGFRDEYQEIVSIGVDRIFGLSLQASDYQQESKERLNLPFELLSDVNHKFTHSLQLPTFEVAGELFLKRHTLVFFRGRIKHVFYPVFPPDAHAAEVIRWVNNSFTNE